MVVPLPVPVVHEYSVLNRILQSVIVPAAFTQQSLWAMVPFGKEAQYSTFSPSSAYVVLVEVPPY
jgi:hypothetical protein